MNPSTSALERPEGSNGHLPGSNPEVAEIERGAKVLETLKEVFAAELVDCLEEQREAETQLRTLASAGKVDRSSIIAMRAVHRCMMDRAKLLLGAIKVAKDLDYKRPQRRVTREA